MSTSENIELTKEYITDALFALMDQKPYEEITITDIATKAGVGRATYYRHFKSKEDIIRGYFLRENHKFLSIASLDAASLDDYYGIIFNVFSLLKENKSIVKRLISAHLEYLYLDYINKAMEQNYLLYKNYSKPYDPYYAAGSLFNVSIQWVKNDCRESVKQMTDAYIGILFHASRSPVIQSPQQRNTD